jgi:hypothetical protein
MPRAPERPAGDNKSADQILLYYRLDIGYFNLLALIELRHSPKADVV